MFVQSYGTHMECSVWSTSDSHPVVYLADFLKPLALVLLCEPALRVDDHEGSLRDPVFGALSAPAAPHWPGISKRALQRPIVLSEACFHFDGMRSRVAVVGSGPASSSCSRLVTSA